MIFIPSILFCAFAAWVNFEAYSKSKNQSELLVGWANLAMIAAMIIITRLL